MAVVFKYGQWMFIKPSYPTLSYTLYIAVQSAFYVVFVTLVLKNPGVKSQPREVKYVAETL